MITSLITANIEHYLLYASIILFIAGGAASWIYVPLVGKQLAVGFFAVAVAIGAYQLGYNARAQLDKSIELQKQLAVAQANFAQAQADLKTNQDIALASVARAQMEAKNVSALQTKVSDYEEQLRNQDEEDSKKIPGNCPRVLHLGCLLNPADVGSLRGIDANRRARH